MEVIKVKVLIDPTSNDVVIAVAQDCRFLHNGVKFNDVVYLEDKLSVVDYDGKETPIPHKHLLKSGSIVDNPDYIEEPVSEDV